MSSEDSSPALGPASGAAHPKAMLRATAHPTRVQILQLLLERPSMTATECAALLHLTPKTCSYHLTTLASSGLIEEVPVPGRSRPWRLTVVGAGRAPAVAAAPAPPAGRTQRVRAHRDADLLDAAAGALAVAPSVWAAASAVHVRMATMSPAEVAAWAEEVERITSKHVRRAAHAASSAPGEPAAGSERIPVAVALLFCGYPTA